MYALRTCSISAGSSVKAWRLIASLDLKLLAVVTLEVVRAGARVVAGQVRLFADAAVLAWTR